MEFQDKLTLSLNQFPFYFIFPNLSFSMAKIIDKLHLEVILINCHLVLRNLFKNSLVPLNAPSFLSLCRCASELKFFKRSLMPLHWKKKWSHFDLKSWVTGGTKIRPEIVLIWLSILSHFDSNIIQLIGIPGRILVPTVTQLFWSKWLHFFFQCSLSSAEK